MTKKPLVQPLCSHFAKLRHRTERHRLARWVSGRALAVIALGTALSIGGVTDTLQNVHFLLQKDLDAVRVVKDDGNRATVVAKLNEGVAADSLFKLSRILPDALVRRRIALFEDQWLPEPSPVSRKRGVFAAEMARINDAIRHDFFANVIPFGDLIHDKAQKYDVDPALVAAVVETESKFHDRAVSSKGARGLMQLMPGTGRWLGVRNFYDPEQNVDAGVRYLKYLQERFDGNLKKTIAAYNAGEGNVLRYDGIPPFRETRSYVRTVLSRYRKRKQQFARYGAEPLPAGR